MIEETFNRKSDRNGLELSVIMMSADYCTLQSLITPDSNT